VIGQQGHRGASRATFFRIELNPMALDCAQNLVVAELVLDLEHGLARPYEGQQLVAFLVLEALLVNRELEVIHQLRDLVEIVLQPIDMPRLCAS